MAKKTDPEYINKFRGKFQMDVIIRVVMDTQHEGTKGLADVLSTLALKLDVKSDNDYFSVWEDAHILNCDVLKFTHTELNQQPMVEITTEDPATTE